MKMHVLSGGRIRMKKAVFIPDAARTDLIELPVMCFLLRHPQGNVLFDTGCHPLAAVDPEARWGGMARMMTLLSGHDDNVIGGLAALGFKPEDIDVVVNSHLHTDHCGCNEFFTRATILCHALELQAARAENAEQNGFLERDWKHPMPMKAFDGEHDLFGDERIVLLPLPGHTPGTSAALVSLEREGRFLLVADAVSLKHNLEFDHSPRNTWNPELAANSRAEVRRVEASGACVVFGHDAEQWDSLRKGVEFYD